MLILSMHFLSTPAPACCCILETVAENAMPFSVESVIDQASRSFCLLLRMTPKETRKHLRPILADMPIGLELRKLLIDGHKLHGWPVVKFCAGGEIMLTIAFYGDTELLGLPTLGDPETN